MDSLNKKFLKNIGVVNIKKDKGEYAVLKVGFIYLLNKKNINKLNFTNDLNLSEIAFYFFK